MLTHTASGWRVHVESTTGPETTSIWYDVAAKERADAESRALKRACETDPGRKWRVVYAERRMVEGYRTKTA